VREVIALPNLLFPFHVNFSSQYGDIIKHKQVPVPKFDLL
jgi:hypothetical protein